MSAETPEEGIVAAIKIHASEEYLQLVTEGMYQDEVASLIKEVLGKTLVDKLKIKGKIFHESRDNPITPEKAYIAIVDGLRSAGYEKAAVDGYLAQLRETISLRARKDVYAELRANLPIITPPTPGFTKFTVRDSGQEKRRT